MPVDASVESFSELTANGAVVIDFWGPRCQPCLALMPQVEELERAHGNAVKVVKVNASEQRQICRNLKVLGLPTFVFMKDGNEVMERLSGDNVSVEDLKRSFSSLAEA
jgi:thioredoxin 1